MRSTSYHRSLQRGILSTLMLIVLLASFMTGSLPAAHAQGVLPPTQPPASLSADGLTLYNGVIPLVVVADPNPEMQGLKFPAEPELAAAMSDPNAAAAAFSITYKAAGTTDPWGATCQAFPAAAQTAFNAAAAIWASTLQSSVPITISACWSNLGSPVILGYSGGQPLHRDFSGAPKANTWYQGSLANALHGSDLAPSDFDDYITYNSGFTWYYGTDGLTPSGQYDLVTVAAHEMGHGLNFSGSASYSGGTGSFGLSGYPVVYDTFIEDAAGTKLTAYANPSTALGSLLTSGSLWFNGTNANAANAGSRVKVYAPSSWSGGSSYAHLDYATFAGTANSMMVYAVSDGASQHNPGPVTKGLLQDMGWGLGSVVPPTVPTPQLPTGTISDTTPTFTWAKVTGATQYQFAVYNGAALAYPMKMVAAGACGAVAGKCSNTPTNVMTAGAHTWKVRALVSGAWTAFSALKSFVISTVPTPQVPTGTVTDTTPTFTWTKITAATQYQFAVYTGSALSYAMKTVSAGACGAVAGKCSSTPANVLSAGAHTWKVRALIGGAWKAFSAPKAFTVSAASTLPRAGYWASTTGDEFYVNPAHNRVADFAVYVICVRLYLEDNSHPALANLQ